MYKHHFLTTFIAALAFMVTACGGGSSGSDDTSNNNNNDTTDEVTCTYTSTRMISWHKQEFTYGRVEARMKLPQTQGIWPAFWMMGNDLSEVNWPNNGEIDIMEHVGFEPNLTHGALHGPGYSGNTPISGTHDLTERVDANYHVYAIEWGPDSMAWFVDDTEFYSVTKTDIEGYGTWVYDHPFFLLLNVAVGGQWPGYPDETSEFPQYMYVDYVRVYSLDEGASTAGSPVFDMSAPFWSDEFDSINLNNWTFETGDHGWGNRELQNYTAGDNAYVELDPNAGVDNNVLVIEAIETCE